MSKYRIICALLCAAMLASCLFGCGKKDTDADSEGSEEVRVIDISEYTLVRQELITERVLDAVLELQADILEKASAELEIKDDWLDKNETADGKKEILIGDVERTEAKNITFSSNEGYIIDFTDDKILICGQTDEMTVEAINYFSENYITLGSRELKALQYKGGIGQTVPVIYNGSTDYTLIFQENRGSAEFEDMIYEFSRDFGALGGIDSVPMYSIVLGREYSADTRQILIGETGYPETEEIKENLAYDEWAWRITGNKIVIFGYSNETLRLALDSFFTCAEMCSYDRGDSKGVVFCRVTETFGKREGWFDELPKYAGGSFRGATSSGNDNFIGLVQNTDRTEYDNYCALLLSRNYTKRSGNEGKSIISNTYVKDGAFVHVYYVKQQNETRIVTGKASMLAESSAEGAEISVPTVSLVPLDADDSEQYGLGQVIELSDGRFIVIDGGTACCDEVLYNYLKSLNKREDGITVAAWFITHNHPDHTGCFVNFTNKYASSGEIKVEQFFFSKYSLEQCYESEYKEGSGCLPTSAQNMFGILDKWQGCRYRVPLTGDVFTIGGAKIEILLSASDWYPDYHYYDNDAGTVFRITVNGKSVLFLGDNEIHGAKKLQKMYYDEDLRSFAVQMGHHGKGSSVDLYKSVAAEYYYFAANKASFDAHIKSTSVTGQIFKAFNLTEERFMYYGKPGNATGTIVLAKDGT